LAGRTQPDSTTATKLKRIAQISRERPDAEFRWLMPHFNPASLSACFRQLDGKKAAGADGMSKNDYALGLDDRLEDLVKRMKGMSYRPGPVREVLIPKEGSEGGFRALGISNIEDKIVQSMAARILSAIYEPTFRNCSYGFRPGRSCHTAIKDLSTYLHRNTCEVVIDVDLRNYFGSIDHTILINILRERIKDEKFIRYIVRMLKAGVLRDGDLQITEEGSPQGSIASPILSNIFGHYAIDCWFEDTVKAHCRGQIAMFRYCDDIVICCQYRSDATRIRRALEGRLQKFSLTLNPTKTRIVDFDRRAFGRGVKQGTFDFLGFTFYLAHTRHKGNVTAKLKTSRHRLRSKLKKVNIWLRNNRHRWRLPELWRIFRIKLHGHIHYYGVSHNSEWVSTFLLRARRLFFKWINRRSQKRSLDWKQFGLFTQRHPMPRVKVYVPLF
jgi:RNA-directed DNA polymerase